ncbi:hypothetical protein WICPIJ_004775 [Wickerhamomyces pijperi]|uniref:U three protein 23 n=1 Tax=Wickerhamomyces pijperi TaxID=599730 RepID=A0A9P8Q6Z0_WICPI|nr:hypothetical protein WICPIJ_004775 [Wickerhamomyces pijperi]
MRQKRAKAYRKQMLVYTHTFKFRSPYQVLIDDTLITKCHSQSFDLVKGLTRTLQDEVKPMITQCCMQVLYETKNQDLIEYAKGFERRRCGHFGDIKPSHECMKSVVIIDGENKHRYVVATDNERLRFSLRKTPGIPIVYMNRAVMVMESLSKASEVVSVEKEKGKLSAGLNDSGKSKDTKKEGEAGAAAPKKRKGPSEPNPLSVKKKKKVAKTDGTNKDEEENKEEGEKKKSRKRKHKKATSTAETAETSEQITEESTSNTAADVDVDESAISTDAAPAVEKDEPSSE